MLHRPMKSAFNTPSMWLSTSKDFIHWGNHKFLMGPRKGYFDSERIGAGDAPVLTDEGWLETYHGVDKNGRYHLGAILMEKIILILLLKDQNSQFYLQKQNMKNMDFMGMLFLPVVL